MLKESSTWFKLIQVGVLSSLLATCGNYITAWYKDQASIRDTKLSEIAQLRKEVAELKNSDQEKSKTIFKLQLQVVELEARLVQKYDASEEIRYFVEHMPVAAWIKLVEDADTDFPKFRMWHINSHYENMFGVRNELYEEKLDRDIWQNPKVSAGFYQLDLVVFQQRREKCAIEIFPLNPMSPISKDNPLYQAEVCKWLTEITGRLAIAGMIKSIELLPLDKYPQL